MADLEDCFSQMGQMPIPTLSNYNYHSLKDRMESLLQVSGCKRFIVEPEPVLLDGASEADKYRFDSKRERAIGLMKLQLHMSSSQAAILEGIDSPLKARHKIRDELLPKIMFKNC